MEGKPVRAKDAEKVKVPAMSGKKPDKWLNNTKIIK
jgi:hypothetical protein